MAVPRPVLLALVGLAVIASAFLLTRRSANESVSAPQTPTARPAPHPASPPAKAHKPAAHRAVHKAAPAHAKRHAAPAKPAKPAAKPAVKPVAKPITVPGARTEATARHVLAAAKALGEGKVVVFFFSKPGAADDAGARDAVRSLRGMRRVEIFDAGLGEVAAYRPMLSNIGISQIPSTVIVRPGKRAVLLQGFVDAGTLRQNVADALR